PRQVAGLPRLRQPAAPRRPDVLLLRPDGNDGKALRPPPRHVSQIQPVVAGGCVQTAAPAEGRRGASWPLARPNHPPHPGDVRERQRPPPNTKPHPSHSPRTPKARPLRPSPPH